MATSSWAGHRPAGSRYPAAAIDLEPGMRGGPRHRRIAPSKRVPGVLALITLAGVVGLMRYQSVAATATAGNAADAMTGTTAGMAVGAGRAAPVAVLSGPKVPQPPIGTGRTVLGKVVATDYGSVQVQLTVDKGRITSASAVRIPETGGRQGERINTRAVPLLDTAVVRAQSAKIDGITGATLTSTGYKASLQSALDAARKG